MKHQLAVAMCVALFGACGSPSAPVPTPLQTTSPAPPESEGQTYRVSGTVTDDSGLPISGAQIVVDQGPNLPDLNGETMRVWATTGIAGSYDLVLTGNFVQRRQPVFALIKAWRSGQSFRAYTQVLDGQGTGTVKNIRLPGRTINAGQSIEIVVSAESSLCGSPNISLTTVCEFIVIRYPNAGTVNVDARPVDGIVPTLRTVSSIGAGRISVPVNNEDFDTVELEVELPIGTPPQRYVVSTSFQSL